MRHAAGWAGGGRGAARSVGRAWDGRGTGAWDIVGQAWELEAWHGQLGAWWDGRMGPPRRNDDLMT